MTSIFMLLLIFICEIPGFSFQEDFSYEEHATISQILAYLSQIKTQKDIEILHIPLHDQSFYSQDFLKTKEELFFNIYNHNKSQSLLLKDVTQDYSNFSSKIAIPFFTTNNNFNAMTIKTFNDRDFYQEIVFSDEFLIKENLTFRGFEEISIFQIEDFYRENLVDLAEIFRYVKSLAQNRLGLYYFMVFQIESEEIKLYQEEKDFETLDFMIEESKITIFFKNHEDPRYFWTFITENQAKSLDFHEKLCEKIFEELFLLSESYFEAKNQPFRNFRLQELKVLDFYLNLLRELGLIFKETLPLSVKRPFYNRKSLFFLIKFIEKNSFSELFALKNNKDFQLIWKNLKNGLILALSFLEISDFSTSYEKLNEIMNSDLKKIRTFLLNNKENLFDLKERPFFITKYIFSIITAIWAFSIAGYLIYKSPKLQNKKFV